MASGSKRARKDKDGNIIGYQLTVECGTDPITGARERVYRTIKNCSKKQADIALRKLIEEVENGGIITSSSIKLGDWLYEWLNTYLPNIEATTRAGYKERINSCINPTLGHIPLKTLKTSHIQLWVNDLIKRGLSPKTIKNAFLNIKAGLDKAVVLKMIPYNPCAGVELPKLQKPKCAIYTSNEIADLLGLAVGTDMFLIVLLAVSLGLRRGELIALEWKDIDFENKVIHIHRNITMAEGERISKAPKTQAGIRDISIGDNLVKLLKIAHKEYLENKLRWGTAFKDNDLVVSKPNGEGFRPDSITQKWERFVDQNNLKKVRLHGLRHSCATAMVEAGVDIKTIQTRMGHSDISVTMNIYAHSTKAMDKAAGDTMDNVLFSNDNMKDII